MVDSERRNTIFAFNHFNFNVLDVEKSLKFYEEALGLKEVRRKEAEDGSFILVYLGDGKSSFTLELTWLKERTEKYDLGAVSYTHLDVYKRQLQTSL